MGRNHVETNYNLNQIGALELHQTNPDYKRKLKTLGEADSFKNLLGVNVKIVYLNQKDSTLETS